VAVGMQVNKGGCHSVSSISKIANYIFLTVWVYSRDMKIPYGVRYLVGIDEVGRGPIAGPVTVGVFCVEKKNLNKVQKLLKGITDSKKLTAAKREVYVTSMKRIKEQGLCSFSTSSVSAKLIDTKGIVWAVNTALKRALSRLDLDPSQTHIFLDGGLYAPQKYSQETMVKGDSRNWLIGAASVLAKVHRDSKMNSYAQRYPDYRFENHKGYGTKGHYTAISKQGSCDIHRKTWIKG
jgi:ribonuclease HII